MKVKLTLSVDKILVEKAKKMNVNISEFLEDMLSEKLKYRKVLFKDRFVPR